MNSLKAKWNIFRISLCLDFKSGQGEIYISTFIRIKTLFIMLEECGLIAISKTLYRQNQLYNNSSLYSFPVWEPS